jgi:hypothetical protein
MHLHRTRLWRLFHAVCAVFVLSYIAFEVLDLDGSRLTPLAVPVHGAIIAIEATAEVDPINRPAPADEWNGAILSADRTAGEALDHFHIPSVSPLDSARIHGYRVGLPRDAIPD